MKKALKTLIVLTLIFAMLTGCDGTGTTDEESSYVKPEVLRVGVGSTYPWGFSENDVIQGFTVDVWNEIGERIGVEIEFSQYSNAEGLYGAMDSDRIDVVASQVAITPAIEEKYAFTDVYGYNVIKMCVQDSSDAQSIEDLHGKKVCIEPGGKLAEFFNGYNEKLSDDEKIELVFTEGSIWEELELGRFDSFPITVLSFRAREMKGEDRNIKLIGDPIITEDDVYPVQKDMAPELLDEINAALKSMAEDGFMTETSIKWYGIDLTDKANL